MQMNLDWNEHTQYSLIAPCGMNCGICLAHLREKNVCKGCRNMDPHKSKSRVKCIIKNCARLQETESGFCFECSNYPCTRLKQLDKRYRVKYKMSMMENLENIRKSGLEAFILAEQKRWKCPTCRGTICVHKGFCLTCN